MDWTPTVGVEIPVHLYHTAAEPPAGFVHAPLPTAAEVSWNPQVSSSVDIPIATVTEASAPPAPYVATKI